MAEAPPRFGHGQTPTGNPFRRSRRVGVVYATVPASFDLPPIVCCPSCSEFNQEDWPKCWKCRRELHAKESQ